MALKTWTGGGGDNNWSTGANWGGSAPIAGDDLAFGGTTRLTPYNDIAADTSFNSITFNSGAGAFTLSGNRITLAGDITQNDNSLQTINLAMIINVRRNIYLNSGDLTINGIISGSDGLDVEGIYTLTLTADNTFLGYIWMLAGTLSVAKITNKGVACPLGAQTTDYEATIWLGAGASTAILKYTGTGHTHDRPIDMYGTTGGATIEQAGTGLLKFTGLVHNDYVPGAKTLTLQGSTAGTGEISGVIETIEPGPISVEKQGTGTWTLSAVNTYTGTTTISAGTLKVNGSTAAGSAVSVSSGGILSGSGYYYGTVSVAGGGIVAPAGVASEVTLDTGALTLNGTSILNWGLGTSSDKVTVTGALTLDGSIFVTAVAGFAPGAYLILTYTGALTNNGLSIGALPSGYSAAVSAGGGNVYLTVSNARMTRKQFHGQASGQRNGME